MYFGHFFQSKLGGRLICGWAYTRVYTVVLNNHFENVPKNLRFFPIPVQYLFHLYCTLEEIKTLLDAGDGLDMVISMLTYRHL